jgi:hypothetical protein
MNQRGFLPVGLLASPTLWLGIGCALLAFTTWASYNRWQAAVEREAKVRGEFAAFTEGVKQRGEEREKETADKEAKDRETFKLIKAKWTADLASRDAALQRLRDRPPTDSGGRPLSSLSACPAGPDGAAGQQIPAIALADYRALEERSYDDALRLSRLQEWVRAIGHPVE